MKVNYLFLLTVATTCGSSAAFGFAEFARGEALLSTTGRATYDSRVFGGVAPADDYIFTLEPRLIYRREAGQLKLEAIAGTRINRYYDFNELNSEDLITSLKLRLPPEGATAASGNFETIYDEHTEVNYDVNRRVREKTFLSRLNTDIPTGLKTTLLLGGSFRRDQRNQFSDRETREGTAGFRYLNFLGGSAFDLRYRRLEVETTGGNDFGIPIDQQSDVYSATLSRPLYHDVRGSISYGYRVLHRSQAEVFNGSTKSAGTIISVNLDGPLFPEALFPKIESSLSLGYQKAETPGINDTGGSRFVGSAHLAWHARERSRIFLDARRALELSINDLTVETTAVNIGVAQSIGNFTSATASAGYEQRKYRTLDRHDNVFIAQTGVTYRITSVWVAAADYRYRTSDSSSIIADYSRHVVTLSATCTF